MSLPAQMSRFTHIGRMQHSGGRRGDEQPETDRLQLLRHDRSSSRASERIQTIPLNSTVFTSPPDYQMNKCSGYPNFQDNRYRGSKGNSPTGANMKWVKPRDG